MRLVAEPAITAGNKVDEFGWAVIADMSCHVLGDPGKIEDRLQHVRNVRPNPEIEAAAE
jgi:hypothetical protein